MRYVKYKGKEYAEPAEDSQLAFHALNIHSFRYYPNDELLIMSDLCCNNFGCKKFYPYDMKTPLTELIYAEDLEKCNRLFGMINDGKTIVSDNMRSVKGKNFYKVTLARLEEDENGNPIIVAGMIEDFDENMNTAQIFQMLSSDYESVYLIDFENDEVTPYRMLSFINNRYGTIMSSKPSYNKIMELYIEENVVDEEKEDMRLVTSREHIQKRLKDREVYMHDFRIMRDGKLEYIRIKVVKLLEHNGELLSAVMGFANVSKERNIEWERLAYKDLVTGGYNFTYYSEKLKDEKRMGYIVSMDLRSFRLVNSVYGLEKGDYVLKTVSEIVAENVCEIGYYGHMNADHFVFYLAFDKENKVIDVLHKITDDIDEFVIKENILRISPYFGVTRWMPGMRSQVIFSEANTAKHNAKDREDDNYCFFREIDTKKALEEKEIEDAFEDAVREKQFEVWYQPKYIPLKRELSGAEALIRWRKPDGELVSPGVFIPVYEKNGMIRKLDEYVFKEVCRQQKEWIENVGRTVPVSINLSRASMYHETIVEDYKKIVDEIGIPPEIVPIEITESAAVANNDIKTLADRFFVAGFPLHIDDFGTGYSSLSTLNLMRFDTLKLDKSLIDYIGNFGGDRLLKHTIALAKDLGLQVTAEGVENEKQVDFLEELECDNIQGFVYSRPMPAEYFVEKLKGDVINAPNQYCKGQMYTYPMLFESCKRACSDASAEKIEGHAAIQINITGEGEGAFYIAFSDGKVDVQPYQYFDRDALITVPSDVLAQIARGVLSIEEAYHQQKLFVEGDWGVVLLLDQIAIRK